MTQQSSYGADLCSFITHRQERRQQISDRQNLSAENLQRSDWEIRFDMAKAAVAISPKRVLDMIATDRVYREKVSEHAPSGSALRASSAG